MNNHIEVVGSASYEEHPDTFLLDVDVFVRAAKESSAQSEIKTLVNQIIDSLLQHGLTKDEVFFGGKETFTPWWKRNKSGIETRNRISIKASNQALIYQAVESIESLDCYQNNKRIRIEVDERQPIYNATEGVINDAMKQAMNDALSKAHCLAVSSGCKVGKVLEIQEMNKGIRGSGSYGDYDYGDGMFAMVAAGGSVADDYDVDPAARLQSNARIVTLKYRVKYQLMTVD